MMVGPRMAADMPGVASSRSMMMGTEATGRQRRERRRQKRRRGEESGL
jgi:hypothetical protein